MVLNLIIFVLIVAVLYTLAHPDSQFAATASAIRQIWSGSCRLNCCQSEFSGVSGLSALGPHGRVCVARTSEAGPSGCVCESCPCALIENVLSTWRPAASMYTRAMNIIATFFYSAFESLSNVYTYMQRVMDCGASCQRPQLLDTTDADSQNIYFGNKDRESILKAREKPRRSDTGLRSSRSIVFRDNTSDTIVDRREGRSEGIDVKNGVSDVTLKPKKESKVSASSGQLGSCPKCKEKGEVCIKSCPKAVKKK